MKKYLFLTLKLSLVAIIFYFLFQKVHFNEIIEKLKHATLWPIITALLLFLVNRVITAKKWSLLLKFNDIHIPLLQLLRIVLVSHFLGLIIPTSLSVDLIRLTEIYKREKKMTANMSSLLADRLLSTLSMTLLSITAALYLWNTLNHHTLMIVILCALGLSLLILGIMTEPSYRLLNWILSYTSQWIRSPLSQKIHQKLTELHSSLVELLKDRKTFSLVLGLNFLLQFFRVTQFYLLFISLGTPVPFIIMMAYIPLIILITMIPITFQGFGVKEGVFVYLFGQIGIAPTITLSVSLMSYFLQLPGILLGALVFVFYKTFLHRDP